MKPTKFNCAPKRVKRKETKTDPKCQEATPEILRIEIDQIFREFLDDPDQTEYIFPPDLNNLQRKYIHNKAQAMNLSSKSQGKEPNRQLHIKKKSKQLSNQSFKLVPCRNAQNLLSAFVQEPVISSKRPSGYSRNKPYETFSGKLVNGPPSIPSEINIYPEIAKIRSSLPICDQREEILETIRNNQVTIISSETGSGKTTQVPQYILEGMRALHKPCKIICTQPRRISTVAAAERVSFERGSRLGGSVGYHIKLEQNYGLATNLIYCTTGVFLRNLMNGGDGLQNITHLIIDEIHERDKLSDFLIICLKQNLTNYPNLRIILMSATVNTEKFLEYFGSGRILSVPGRLFAIDVMFLEQILLLTKYKSPKMREAEQNSKKERMSYFIEEPAGAMFDGGLEEFSYMDEALEDYLNFSENYDYRVHYEEATAQLGMYFLSEGVSVDYQHSKTGRTALMIAAYLGDKEFISRLCSMGADTNLCDKLGKTALDYATENPGIARLLDYIQTKRTSVSQNGSGKMEAEHLLQMYDKTTPDDFIDYELIVTLISFVHRSNQEGSVLVFLPGYDDIMICNDRIIGSTLDPQTYQIFFLHGSMNIRDQHNVFKKLFGKRKIILSTNIAETSITIDDVVFVIDTGKAKEKCYDSYNKVSSLQTRWISQACAKQRMGRAGRTRPGMCFRIYSQQRYENMDEERIPEMLRVSLEELCLHSKILAPDGMNIHNFLMLAPDPPSANSIRVAIENLQFLGALDKEEDLTRLGEYLAQLTVEPHLGKILIFGVIFKCLEPILTLVAAMTHKDPFQLPPQANLKTQAAETRKKLLNGILSDHLLYLEIFRKWQESSCEGRAKQFCESYFISYPTMNSILETRTQILAQLRALNFVHQSNSMEAYNLNANCWPLVKAIIGTGLYPNLAYPYQGNIATRREKKVSIQHSSGCWNKPITTWLLYDEMIKHKTNLIIRGVTAVTSLTIPLMCGNDVIFPTPDSFFIDDWLEFKLPDDSVMQLRKSIDNLVKAVLAFPNHYYSDYDTKVLNTLTKILDFEEIYADLEIPASIGEKPKFFFPQNEVMSRRTRHTANGHGQSRNYSTSGQGQSYSRNFNGELHKTSRKPGRKLLPYAGNFTDEASGAQTVCDSIQNLNLSRDNYYSGRNQSLSAADKLLNGIYNDTRLSPVRTELSAEDFGTSSRYGNYPDEKLFLLIKPKLFKNVEIAYCTSKWIFAPQTEKKILSFSYGTKPIFLLFTVLQSHAFQGIAKFVNIINDFSGKPTAVIEWIFNSHLSFRNISHLKNAYNFNKPIYDGLDGQVIKQSVGEELFRIYQSLVESHAYHRSSRNPNQASSSYCGRRVRTYLE